tara:strand:+ start:1718 stop:3064 length:1347 start_codon:yes stop_codon:yes gene_type:complete
MDRKKTKKNIILFDYYENHPLGIIYDWIRSKPPNETIILKHLCYVNYCKSGEYKLRKDNFITKIAKVLRSQLILKFLAFKGYQVFDLDKEIIKLNKNKYSLNILSQPSKLLIYEIIRDFVCQKDIQFSCFDTRINHIYDVFNKSINETWNKYQIILKELLKQYDSKDVFIFNGRAARQKLISDLFKNNSLNIFYIERNMWNIGRTIISEKRIHSFSYLKTDKCSNYGESKHDMSISKLYKSVMLKNWENMQTDRFQRSNKDKRLISYLSGSSDEYLAFTDEVMMEDCKSQIKLVKFLSDLCIDNDIDFLLRVHPNTRNKCQLDIDLWDNIGQLLISRNQRFYSATSNVNTYSIIEESDQLITISSTVAVESCLKGKDICICGYSGLRYYNSSKIIRNLEDLKEYLLVKDLPRLQKDEIISESRKYLMDELQAGKLLEYYSMEKSKFII